MNSAFEIHNIILMESNFNRVANVIFEESLIDYVCDIDVKVHIEGTKVNVLETIVYTQTVKETKLQQVFAKIGMIGVFNAIGDSDLNLKTFGEVNGAAIVFPYLREHLTSLSIKASLPIVLIPPANFMARLPEEESK